MTNQIYYETEFVETGPAEPIRFLSIGMVTETGRKLYAVTQSVAAIDAAVAHPWARDNVLPHLPVKVFALGEGARTATGRSHRWHWDTEHPDYRFVRPNEVIAADVAELVLANAAPQLWAWYGAYDHILLAQLFGNMGQLPPGFPMHTCDLQQECDRLGNPDLPAQPDGEHNALADALHNRTVARFMAAMRDADLVGQF